MSLVIGSPTVPCVAAGSLRRLLGVLCEHLDGVAALGDNAGDRRTHVSCSDNRDSGHGILLMVGGPRMLPVCCCYT